MQYGQSELAVRSKKTVGFIGFIGFRDYRGLRV